jgi:CTD small phosphatase-like protein 2
LIDDGINVYTLVLDLDETLIHYDEEDPEGAFYIRPGALTFLHELSLYYDIVVFTAGMPDVSFSHLTVSTQTESSTAWTRSKHTSNIDFTDNTP